MTSPSPRPIAAIRLDGGRLCLDFVNTIHDRFAAGPEDYLATPERYVEWARRTGALGSDEDVAPPGSGEARLMKDVRTLRDALFRVLAASIDGHPLPADALRVANAWLLEARKDQALGPDGQLVQSGPRGDARRPLKCIALDLVDTLEAARAGRLKLKHCANQTSCGWLFADTTKNGKRRWCAMQTCGTLSKMATQRERSQA
ncbi:CGNR zinc finger domain-containing protein [Asticcacaulis solisilvae]|uniref:CGNR zinc finger domain-containing protein n=1 Tax=Asticcacaulis solisilvae TaxID=1217274 RepID=UPI003FD7525D